MTPEDRLELDRLLHAVIQEKDPAKFTVLVTALNDFLEKQSIKLKPSAQSGDATPSS
jgi:hypothetical protein